MRGRGLRNITGRIVALSLSLALSASAATAGRVDPADYRQFWIWAGARPAPYLENAQTLYLLQGRIAKVRGETLFTRQGVAPFGFAPGEIFLVYRLETLDWNGRLLAGIENEIRAFEHAGSRIAGIQLDFDTRTPKLAGYAAYLAEVRGSLPRAYRLSVTGLLDWSTGGSPEAFDAMAGTVDEIVFQAYRGRDTIPGYRRYLAAIARLRLPFKIGLVAGGAWDRGEERLLAASSFYRGAVVFLAERQ